MNQRLATTVLNLILLLGWGTPFALASEPTSARDALPREAKMRKPAVRQIAAREITEREAAPATTPEATTPASETSRANAHAGRLEYSPKEWPEAPDSTAMLRRLALGTVTVLALCIGTLLVARRWLQGTPPRATSGSRLRVLETVSLGNRCVVHLIQSGDHQVLAGIDAGGFKSLVPLPASFEQAIASTESNAFEHPIDAASEEFAEGQLPISRERRAS